MLAKKYTFLLLCLLPFLAGAQTFSKQLDLSNPNQRHFITTQRGDRFIGRIEEMSGTTILFRIKSDNLLSFSFSELQFVGVLGEDETLPTRPMPAAPAYVYFVRGEDNTSQNLIYSPTAFGYKPGTGEYRNVLFGYNSVDYGVSENFSLGGSAVVPVIFGARLKANFSLSPILHIGVGANAFLGLFDAFDSPLSLHAFGIGTLGTRNLFLNVTAGRFFSFESDIDDARNIYTIGGGARLSSRWDFRAEVVMLRSSPTAFFDDSVTLPGFQFAYSMGRSRFDFGFAFFGNLDDFFFPFPVLGYTYRF